VLNQGEYRIYIGTSQPDERSAVLTGQKPECVVREAENQFFL